MYVRRAVQDILDASSHRRTLHLLDATIPVILAGKEELKLQLMRICTNNRERYIEESSEPAFWQYITALFKQETGHQGADVRKKVTSIVGDRKADIAARKMLSGVALPAATDLEQATDSWIEICEHRAEIRDNVKSEASTDIKKEKVIAEVLRDNLTKRLSKKRDFQAVLEARELVDLTSLGDVIQKRRQIRQNLRANRSRDRDSREESRVNEG
ncbi:hypothetical protein BGX38DRAFT_1143062 [Terfezia claveryi]|nr:hypothetical protein BGX38DRAFT_1143062 [Terfezia claveryi]